MRTIRFASTLLLLLTACVAASAQAAQGTYRFTVGDKYIKYVEFECQALKEGGATGRLNMSDEAPVVLKDVDGDGSPEERYPGFSISVSFDEMTVVKNQAVMGGVVRDSTIPYLIGQRVLFTVEDNAENPREPDKLTWGLYKEIRRDWIPSDAELEKDEGVGLRWWATDAEVKGDVGYAMPRDESVKVASFPFAAYLFVDTDNWEGDIIVRP